jgi:hypothetical protein
VKPDWYPDPSNPSQQRFWDGIVWTEHIYGPGGRGTDGGLPGAPPPSAAGGPESWPTPADPQPWKQSAEWSGGYGPVGRPTSPAIQILLTVVTLGIWALVWIYRQYRDMKRYSGIGLGGGVGLLINFIPYIGVAVSFFVMANEVQQLYEREGQRPPVTTVYGLLFLVPLVGGLIWYLLMQRALNEFWIGHGAPRP